MGHNSDSCESHILRTGDFILHLGLWVFQYDQGSHKLLKNCTCAYKLLQVQLNNQLAKFKWNQYTMWSKLTKKN